jgi:hypothetical protein
VSLTAGDAAESKGRGAFHLSLNRLNVALSRARTKAVLVASAHAFRALPHDADGLRMASRGKELRDRLHQVDLTRLYVVGLTAEPHGSSPRPQGAPALLAAGRDRRLVRHARDPRRLRAVELRGAAGGEPGARGDEPDRRPRRRLVCWRKRTWQAFWLEAIWAPSRSAPWCAGPWPEKLPRTGRSAYRPWSVAVR